MTAAIARRAIADAQTWQGASAEQFLGALQLFDIGPGFPDLRSSAAPKNSDLFVGLNDPALKEC